MDSVTNALDAGVTHNDLDAQIPGSSSVMRLPWDVSFKKTQVGHVAQRIVPASQAEGLKFDLSKRQTTKSEITAWLQMRGGTDTCQTGKCVLILHDRTMRVCFSAGHTVDFRNCFPKASISL